MVLRSILFVLLLIFSEMLYAQETEHKAQGHFKNSVSAAIGHAHVNRGIRDGERKWLTLPSWILSYNFYPDEKWAIGLHSDIILEYFEVEQQNTEGAVLTRSYPVSFVLAATYNITPHLGLIGGGGVEYEKDESFGLVRIGLEPKLHILPHLELIGVISYDINIDAYDTWNLGLGVAYLF